MSFKIHLETSSDYPAINEVNNLAFWHSNERKLVENLLKSPNFISKLSLVAEVDGKNSWAYSLFPCSN